MGPEQHGHPRLAARKRTLTSCRFGSIAPLPISYRAAIGQKRATVRKNGDPRSGHRFLSITLAFAMSRNPANILTFFAALAALGILGVIADAPMPTGKRITGQILSCSDAFAPTSAKVYRQCKIQPPGETVIS